MPVGTNIQLCTWRDGVAIDFEISRWSTGAQGVDGLLVTFVGTYRPGSRGNGDGRFIAMVISAALAWEVGHSMVIDLQRLDYIGGDMLTYWESSLPVARIRGRGGFPVVYCASPANVDAIRSLVAESADTRPEEIVLFDRDSALNTVIDALRRAALSGGEAP